MSRILLPFLLLALLATSGCGLLWNPQPQRTVQPESEDSDLTFVRTGDRQYYYIIDERRGLCFFHAVIRGQTQLAEIDCDRLPEFRRRQPQQDDAPPPRVAPSPEVPDDVVDEDDPGATGDEASVVLTDEDREAFRRAWIQRFCAKRAGTDEPLEVLLSRHRLDTARWQAARDEFSADKDAWTALTGEAMAACP